MVELSRKKFLTTAVSAAAGFSTIGWTQLLGAHDRRVPLFTAQIPGSGESLPRIGLGTYSTFDVGSDAGEIRAVREVLNEFYSLGGRLIDSSPMYGSAEQVTGDVSAELGLNAGLFMATKVWISGAEAGRRQMADSLAKLRRQKIELMQIHNLVDWRTQIKTLREYKEKGIFKYIGITHYLTSAFGELSRMVKSEKLDFLQIPYSLGETSAAREGRNEASLLAVAHEHGVAVIANEPFGQGRLFSRVRGKQVPAWAVERGITTWSQYFLKFILSEPRVQFVIPATRKLSHLRENMAAGTGYLPSASERRMMQRDFL